VSGRIGDGDSTSEKKQHNLNPNTQCAGGVKTALFIIVKPTINCALSNSLNASDRHSDWHKLTVYATKMSTYF